MKYKPISSKSGGGISQLAARQELPIGHHAVYFSLNRCFGLPGFGERHCKIVDVLACHLGSVGFTVAVSQKLSKLTDVAPIVFAGAFTAPVAVFEVFTKLIQRFSNWARVFRTGIDCNAVSLKRFNDVILPFKNTALLLQDVILLFEESYQ